MVVKVVYVLGLFAMVLGFLVFLIAAFGEGFGQGLATLVIGPI